MVQGPSSGLPHGFGRAERPSSYPVSLGAVPKRTGREPEVRERPECTGGYSDKDRPRFKLDAAENPEEKHGLTQPKPAAKPRVLHSTYLAPMSQDEQLHFKTGGSK